MFTSWTRCNSKMDATNTVQSWGHPQSDSLGSYTSSEIGSKLSKHGIHLDRFFRDAHALCTCICVLWAFPKTIDAHSICLWYSVCPMSMPIRPVGIPIMSCGLSHYAQWALPLCPVGTPNPPISYCVPYTGYLQPALWAYLHGDPYALWAFPSCPWHSLYALWAFPLCPVGIHITPCGHSHYSPWALPSRSPNPHFILCPICLWSSVCPAYPHGHPCAQWAFPLCPVGIPIMPCGHSQQPQTPWGFQWHGFLTDLEKCLNLNTVLKTAWFSNLPWKLSIFSWKLLENDFSGLEKLDSQISYLFVCFSMLLEHLSWKT